jgi:hypothetical protein
VELVVVLEAEEVPGRIEEHFRMERRRMGVAGRRVFLGQVVAVGRKVLGPAAV